MEQQSVTLFDMVEYDTTAGKKTKRLLEHKRSFIFHYDEMSVVMELDDEQAGKFLKSIIAHVVLELGMTVRSDIAQTDGQLEELIETANSNGILHVLFRQFLTLFRTDTERYQRRVKAAQANGQKGGAPKGNKNARSARKAAEENNLALHDCTPQGDNAAHTRNSLDKASEEKFITHCFSDDSANTNKQKTTQNNQKQAKQPTLAKDRAKERAEVRAEDGAEERAEGFEKAPDGAEKRTAATGSSKKAPPCDYRRLMEHFNRLFAGILPEVKAMNENRRRAVRARLAEYGDRNIERVLEKVRQSAFLTGGGRSGWRASFDWIFAPRNFAKILEGNYDYLRDPHPAATGFIPAAEQERRRNDLVKQHIFEKALAHVNGTAVETPLTDCPDLAAAFFTRISAS